jgi:hypothetical protein
MTLYTITLFVTAFLLTLSLQKKYYTELYHIIESDLEISIFEQQIIVLGGSFRKSWHQI